MNQTPPAEIKSFVVDHTLHNFTLKEVRCSTVAIALVFKFCSNSNTHLNACYDSKGLKEFILFVRDISFESDFMMPIIAAFPLHKDQEDISKMLYHWQRDQELHQGNFFIYPYINDPDEMDKLDNLLDPRKPDLTKYIPRTYTIDEFKQDARKNDQLNDKLRIIITQGLEEGLKKTSHQLSDLNSWINFWKKTLGPDRPISNQEDTVKASTSPDEPSQEAENPREDAPDFNRIKSITIKNFKGLSHVHLNLDADIVLISGPNGHGKSTLVEALSLALNRFHPDMKKAEKGEEKEWPQKHFFHYGASKFEITVQDRAKQYVQVSCPPPGKDDSSQFSGLNLRIKRPYIQGGAAEYESDDTKLMFRLSTFLPDHVKMLFDEENSKERLIYDLFEPLPVAIQGLYDALESILDDSSGSSQSLHTRINKINNDNKQFEHITKQLPDNVTALGEIFSPLRQMMDLPDFLYAKVTTPPNVEAIKAGLEELKSFLKDNFGIFYSESWKNTLRDSLPKEVRNYLAEKQGGDYSQLLKHEKRTIGRLSEIERILTKGVTSLIPCHKELSTIFSFLGDSDRISPCMDALKSNKVGAHLNDIADELELVDTNKAQTCGEILDNLESKMTRQLLEEKESLESELEKIKKEMSSSTTNIEKLITEIEGKLNRAYESLTEIDRFSTLEKSVHQRRVDLEELRDQQKQFTALKEMIEEKQKGTDRDQTQEDVDHLTKIFETTFNSITERFALGKGMEKMNVKKRSNTANGKKNRLDITADETDIDSPPNAKRDKACFSLGQRSQIALAFLLTSRELIQNSKNITFPHRVIILDDPSSTFDMTNLLSQAILWRQLAYHPDPKKRYQLFIVSHHELFTDRLLDLLCPPGGDDCSPGGNNCSMLLLRFSQWAHRKNNSNSSPIETYMVDPAPREMEQSIKAFEHGLKCQENCYG